MTIRRYRPDDKDAVIALILSIQRQEFAIPITAEDQPDLADIPGFYQAGAGDFWVAEHAGAVVGTVGLKDIGAGEAALRKMFVAHAHRGPARIAARLLETLVAAARAHGLHAIYLGTTDKFVAAHRFYEKSGFQRLAPEALPPAFPRMAVDTRFYRLSL